jgi:hypothetical protein
MCFVLLDPRWPGQVIHSSLSQPECGSDLKTGAESSDAAQSAVQPIPASAPGEKKGEEEVSTPGNWKWKISEPGENEPETPVDIGWLNSHGRAYRILTPGGLQQMSSKPYVVGQKVFVRWNTPVYEWEVPHLLPEDVSADGIVNPSSMPSQSQPEAKAKAKGKAKAKAKDKELPADRFFKHPYKIYPAKQGKHFSIVKLCVHSPDEKNHWPQRCQVTCSGNVTTLVARNMLASIALACLEHDCVYEQRFFVKDEMVRRFKDGGAPFDTEMSVDSVLEILKSRSQLT